MAIKFPPLMLIALAVLGISFVFVPRETPKSLGIDLGTTFSGISYYKNGSVIMIDLDGVDLIPSWVAFTETGGQLVGGVAKAQAALNPTRTVYDMKRFIGRNYSLELAEEAKRYPFKIVNQSNVPKVEITTAKGTKYYTPEEIGGIIVKRLVAESESLLGITVGSVVMAVPVEFSERQVEATKKAAEHAGIKVSRIITEPTAAAMAYGLHNNKALHYIVVFDMGGGTLDVSLLSCESGVYTVLTVNGDNYLGGEDVNNVLYDKLEMTLNGGKKIERPTELQKLRDLVEQMKKTLSSEQQYVIDNDLHGKPINYVVTRAMFEEWGSELWERILIPLRDVFDNTNVGKDEIGTIVLVGGSTRIPRVQEEIEKFFNYTIKPYLKVPPEQAVTIGTAVQAAILNDGGRIPTAARENWALIRNIRAAKRKGSRGEG